MNKDVKYILVLLILAYFFFFIGNGIVSLTGPDEVFYVQTAKEMAQHHSWMTPILFNAPQFEKPILIYWLLRVAFLIFGVNSFSARFFPALFALLGVIGVYFFARLNFKEEKEAFILALVLLSSGLYIGLARTVFTDMVFSVLILFSLLSFYWGYTKERYKRAGIILFFVFSALAVLAKGPLGLFIPLMSVIVFLFFERRIRFILCKDVFLGIVIFSIIALPWYILMTVKYNQGFIQEFFYNDHYRRLIEAEHSGNDTWYFYPLTIIGCMFPWSIFVGLSLFYGFCNTRKIDRTNLFFASWITVTFLTFQVAHSKLTSYIFPMFPALALVCGSFIYGSLIKKERSRQFFFICVIMWGIFLLILAGIIIASLKGFHYLSSFRPVYFLVSVIILWLAITGGYILRRKFLAVFYCFILFIPILLGVIPFIYRDIEPYVSSKYACDYLLSNYSLNKETYLLSSKNFVRGVRFYTEMKVAVLGDDTFFSHHPIPYLDSDDRIIEFLYHQPLTYGFLKKSSLKDLERIATDKLGYQVLKNIGDQYIVKIQGK